MRCSRVLGVRAWLAFGLALVGCNAVLGIEDLPNESGDGSVADDHGSDGGGRGGKGGGGRGGNAGTDDQTPGTDGGGAGGKGGSGGSHAGSGGAGGSGGMDAGTDAGGDSGTPDSGTDSGVPPSPDVHGKVIDYYRNPVKDVAVKIGGATATTDANGEFTIAEVSDSYDVALTITAKHYGGTEVAGWLFVGLTRRDPTLQVYRGQQMVSGDVLINVAPANLFPLGSYDTIALAFTSQYGQYNTSTDSAGVNTSFTWEGPDAIAGVAYALHWTDADTAPHVPTAYHSADSVALSMNVTQGTTLDLDLTSSGSLPTGVMAGTVTAPGFADRTNAVFVRYSDDAAIQVVDDYNAPDTFSYLAPTIQNASIVVAATVNTSGYAPFAVAYSDDLAPGTSNIALDVPTPATPLAPAGNSTNVTADTLFTWTGGDQVYVLHVDNDNYLEGFYVVTAAKEARIPAPPLTNLPLAAGSPYHWSVSTHVTHASVDDAAGPDGFLDAYCTGGIAGPRHGHGTHTVSSVLGFTSAP